MNSKNQYDLAPAQSRGSAEIKIRHGKYGAENTARETDLGAGITEDRAPYFCERRVGFPYVPVQYKVSEQGFVQDKVPE